jgi:hypothetical protein
MMISEPIEFWREIECSGVRSLRVVSHWLKFPTCRMEALVGRESYIGDPS